MANRQHKHTNNERISARARDQNGAAVQTASTPRATTRRVCVLLADLDTDDNEQSKSIHSDSAAKETRYPMSGPHTFQAEPAQILLVEDNPGDVRLTKEAFKQGRIENDLHVVSDGDEALSFLSREGEYADVPRPDLILLDLNLPGKDGENVLEELKDDPTLRSIPVIVLTSSSAEEDIARSYELHANAYLTKPVDPDEFIETVRAFEKFWFSVVRLPPEEEFS